MHLQLPPLDVYLMDIDGTGVSRVPIEGHSLVAGSERTRPSPHGPRTVVRLVAIWAADRDCALEIEGPGPQSRARRFVPTALGETALRDVDGTE